MGAALFYHLTRSPPEAVVPVLVEKALAAGWRVELRAGQAEALARLDEALWAREGFLPHGRAGGPHDDRQPVLLTRPGEAAGARDGIIAVAGAVPDAAEVAAAQRAWLLFDAADPKALDTARATWTAWKAAGIAVESWTEESGRWAKAR